jgi:hypothetical protein
MEVKALLDEIELIKAKARVEAAYKEILINDKQRRKAISDGQWRLFDNHIQHVHRQQEKRWKQELKELKEAQHASQVGQVSEHDEEVGSFEMSFQDQSMVVEVR